MKFTLIINQPKIIELGVTNINQAHIFDLLTTCSTWAKTVVQDDTVFYWVSRNLIVEEMPLLNIKPDTVYRHLKSLQELGLIDYQKQGIKDLIRITKKGKKYHSDTKISYVGNESESPEIPMSEINPDELGNESESCSEINPTYKTTTKHHTTNKNKCVKNSIPDLQQIVECIVANNWTELVEAEKFFNWYEEREWRNVPFWKSKLQDWVDRNAKKNNESKSYSEIINPIIEEVTAAIKDGPLSRIWKTDLAYTVFRQIDSGLWNDMSEKGVEYKVKELHKQIKTNGVSLLKYPLQNNVESKPIESNELNDLRFKKQLEDLGVSA